MGVVLMPFYFIHKEKAIFESERFAVGAHIRGFNPALSVI
jgi:hypothetical protein